MAKGTAAKSSSGASMSKYDVEVEARLKQLEEQVITLSVQLQEVLDKEASADTMSKVPSGTYSYDLQYILPSSSGLDTHRTVLRGTFTVNPDVTEAFE